MQRVSDIIAVQGKAGPVVVKNALAVPALPYRAQAAQAQCVAGDRNTFVFTAR
ncbi:fimbrial protein [Bordetella pertussis]|nr:fimbrial protein [Bordetella pertussis]CFM05042.1 fimbrial protein [Bordetella pertussis]CFN10435.1 fimbrial protein [Bordetella pertussis]CFO37075.1 fimbrial protein [Bordetella pertussis]CFP49415.1 fimbrial protein [Bordetella pertussis]